MKNKVDYRELGKILSGRLRWVRGLKNLERMITFSRKCRAFSRMQLIAYSAIAYANPMRKASVTGMIRLQQH